MHSGNCIGFKVALQRQMWNLFPNLSGVTINGDFAWLTATAFMVSPSLGIGYLLYALYLCIGGVDRCGIDVNHKGT